MTDQEDLIKMDDEAFRDFVEHDARKPAGYKREMLLSPDVIDRYFATLTSIKTKVELTIAAKRSDLRCLPESQQAAAIVEFEHWRAGALRFKTSIDELIISTRLHRNETRSHSRFEHAIRVHRQHLDPDDASDADRELWASLTSSNGH